MKRLILAAIACVIAVSLQAQSTFTKAYKTGAKLYVNTESGLSLRDKPSTAGQVLTVVKLGEAVEVVNDDKPRVLFTNTGIPGAWVKVKYQDKTGYQFDGFLSRYPPMPKATGTTSIAPPSEPLLDYLKTLSNVTQELKPIPPGGQDYRAEHIFEFGNGVRFKETPTGSHQLTIEFPKNDFTVQEVFLIARMGWPALFANNLCPYSEDNILCEDWAPVYLRIRVDGSYVVMWYYVSD